jgi:hypothetical protein
MVRFNGLASWVLTAKGQIGRPLPVAKERGAAELEAEAHVKKAKLEFGKAEELITAALNIEPKNIRLYFDRMDLHFKMAQQAYAERTQAEAAAKHIATDLDELDRSSATDEIGDQIAIGGAPEPSAQDKEKIRQEEQARQEKKAKEKADKKRQLIAAREKVDTAKQDAQEHYRGGCFDFCVSVCSSILEETDGNRQRAHRQVAGRLQGSGGSNRRAGTA